MMGVLRYRLSSLIQRLDNLYRDNKKMLLWSFAAAVVISASVALSQHLLGELIFNQTAIGVKSETNKTLKKNVEKAPTLRANVNKLLADETLAILRAGEGDNNFRVVLDALPVSGDPATFATSLQDVILKPSKVTIVKLAVKDADRQGSMHATTPQAVRFSLEIAGDATALKAALLDMERSIRPIQVTSLSIGGSGQTSRAKITGITYYLPVRTVKLEMESIKRP